eukprot:COSAG01_NODE_39378_length_477_cov_0.857143_1_plen_106_part_00
MVSTKRLGTRNQVEEGVLESRRFQNKYFLHVNDIMVMLMRMSRMQGRGKYRGKHGGKQVTNDELEAFAEQLLEEYIRRAEIDETDFRGTQDSAQSQHEPGDASSP